MLNNICTNKHKLIDKNSLWLVTSKIVCRASFCHVLIAVDFQGTRSMCHHYECGLTGTIMR